MIPRIHLIVSALILLASCGISLWFQDRLPNPCPTHWNIHGEVDDYGSPLFAAWLMPMVTIPVMILMIGLPLLGPFRKNIEAFRVTYGRLCVVLTAMFLALHVIVLLAATGVVIRIGAAIGGCLGVLFIFIGNWMGKMRRNLYIGIRTPWTIANDIVWDRTHRLGGRLFVASGLATIAVCPFAPEWLCFVVLIGGITIATVWAVIYSLYCYRKLGQVDDLNSAPQG